MKANRTSILLGFVLANLVWGSMLMAASVIENFDQAGSTVENPLAIAVVGILLVVGSRRKKG
jgi:hypothetical protein